MEPQDEIEKADPEARTPVLGRHWIKMLIWRISALETTSIYLEFNIINLNMWLVGYYINQVSQAQVMRWCECTASGYRGFSFPVREIKIEELKKEWDIANYKIYELNHTIDKLVMNGT